MDAMMETTTLFATMALLILFAVTSLRFNPDSRERFIAKEHDLAGRGNT